MKLKYKKNSILLILLMSIFSVAHCQKIINLKDFGAFGNGINDDTEILQKAMIASQFGNVIDGQNFTYLIKGNIDATLHALKLINIKIITGSQYNKQSIKIISDNVTLNNVAIDGGRGTFKKEKEEWKIFSKENNINSIYPTEPDFLSFIGLSKSASFRVDNFKVVNLHAASAITIITYGNVEFNNIYFENLSNKSFHVYHTVNDGLTQGGTTTVSNATAKDVGILSEELVINGKLYHRKDVEMMPQASFNFIVSFGNFILNHASVENYGSTGITADRNVSFAGNDLNVKNNSINTFSNNPSGAVWFENCKTVDVGKITVSISNRNKKDLNFDSSAIHIYGVDSSIKIDSIDILSDNEGIVLNKGLRGSFFGKTNLNINYLNIKGNYKQAAAFFAVIEGSKISTDIDIKYLSFKGGIVEFYGIENVHINNLIGFNGNENISFKLPFFIDNKENYTIDKTNIKNINSTNFSKRVNVLQYLK